MKKHKEKIPEVTNAASLPVRGGSQLTPILSRKGKWGVFEVSDETFKKFERQHAKFERWAKYLNLESAEESAVYEFAKKNPTALILLRNAATGQMKQIHRGGNLTASN